MKIALITDDGQIISQHFGRAAFYLVITVEDGKPVQREMREKLGHNHFAHQEHGEHHEHHDGDHHGAGPAAQSRHEGMARAISDCQVLIAGGMGSGAYESLRRLQIEPILTSKRKIDDVVEAYLSGDLLNEVERLH